MKYKTEAFVNDKFVILLLIQFMNNALSMIMEHLKDLILAA